MRFLPLVLAFLLAACGGEAPKTAVNVGTPAPAFQSVKLDGSPLAFPEALAGKPVVVRFWADWCKYCEGEMKAIESVYQRQRDKGLNILAVNTGQDRKTAGDFMQKIGVSYPALLDEQSAIAKRYGVVGLPTTFFIDAGGVIRGKIIGEADEATFARHAEALLK